MQSNIRRWDVWISLFVVAVLAGAFIGRAAYNLRRIDYRNSNFVFFWLAGRMVLDAENPYDSAAWLAAHDTHDVDWRPNLVFPYPLPLALLVAPLGLLALDRAYFAWQLVSEILLAAVMWTLLSRLELPRWRKTLALLVICLLLLYFGPVFITLQIGGLGALTLVSVLACMLALEHDRPALAGLAGSLLLLKPPQGAPLLFLIAAWSLARRDWKFIGGSLIGVVLILAAGAAVDARWPIEFAAAGGEVIDRTMGIQSNFFALAYLACGRTEACMWWLGGAPAALVLAGTAFFLWRNSRRLQPWDVLSLSIPVGFVSTLYLWSYDQVLYLIPLVWILRRLLDGRGFSVPALAYLVGLIVVAFIAMVILAYTHSDLVSLGTTILVLAPVILLLRSRGHPARIVTPAIE